MPLGQSEETRSWYLEWLDTVIFYEVPRYWRQQAAEAVNVERYGPRL